MRSKKIVDSLSFLEHAPRSETISIVPIPFDWGSDHGNDVAKGPKYMLDLGLEGVLESAGIKTKLLPEITVSKKYLKKNIKQKSNLMEGLADTLSDIRDVVHGEIARGHSVISLGGDHTISIGTIAGASAALDGDLGVIWIDIHADAQTHATSLSQNPHGMSTMALLGIGDKRLSGIVDKKIKKGNFVYIGLRDLDKAEIDNIRTHKLASVTMMDIAEDGLAVVHESIKGLNKKVRNVWVSLDLDSIDASIAPASAMATPGGFSHREIVSLITRIGKTCNVVGLDIVELTPNKDVDGKTGLLVLELAAAAFRAKYNWYTRHMNKYGDWYAQQ